MKNKQLVWISSVVVALLFVGGGVWLWHAHQTGNKVASDLYGAGTNASQYEPRTTDTSGTAQQQTIQGTTTQTDQGSTQLSAPTTTAQNTAQISGSNSTSTNANAEVSKLLDSTTFAQYDKYKSGTNAQYIDLQTGTGAALGNGQKAAVYYRGWLTNGTMFDQSRAGSDGTLQTFAFTLGEHQVISGWEQGLAGMKVGGVRLLIIPPAVGYGASGQASIPGNSVLIFQVQLVAVQ